MARGGTTYWFLVLIVIGGLGLLVYGMSLTAGKSLNPPAIIGGLLIIGAIAGLAFKIARLPEPTL